VNPNAVVGTAVLRHRHVDHRAPIGAETPKVRSGEVAQQRPWPTRKHGSEVTNLPRKRCVAHGVHTSVPSMKQSTSDSSRDRGRVQAEVVQLAGRDEPFLSAGAERHGAIDVTKGSPGEGFVTHTPP
jgi:hypothetical protein